MPLQCGIVSNYLPPQCGRALPYTVIAGAFGSNFFNYSTEERPDCSGLLHVWCQRSHWDGIVFCGWRMQKYHVFLEIGFWVRDIELPVVVAFYGIRYLAYSSSMALCYG